MQRVRLAIALAVLSTPVLAQVCAGPVDLGMPVGAHSQARCLTGDGLPGAAQGFHRQVNQ
jgi:hypothetical protein